VATTPPEKKGKKKGKGRVYLALGLVALLVFAYVVYRRSSTSAATGGGVSSGQQPTGDGSAGGLSGSPADNSSLQDLLDTLAAENGSLLNSLLGTRIGTGSFGGPPPSATEPPPPQTPSVPSVTTLSTQPSSAATELSAADFSVSPYQGQPISVTGVSAPVAGFDQYPILDLSNVSVPSAPGYSSIEASPLPVEQPASGPNGYPTLDLSNVPDTSAATSFATPAQVNAGQAAVNEKPVVTPHGRAL
jgi:hypothetical protein